jgi:hypothetical protein
LNLDWEAMAKHSLDPVGLVRHEMFEEFAVGIESESGEDGRHGVLDF